MPAQNRKQRRAAATANGPTVDSIPMAQPDRSRPTGKTLFDLAEEREAELWDKADKENARRRRDRAGQTTSTDDAADVDHVLTTVTYSISLGMLHFTLDVLVWHQYAMEIAWPALLARVALAFPALLIAVYLAHTRTAAKMGKVRQALFMATAVAAGCILIHNGNQGAYMAVMKNSAPTGVVWVWCVIEMKLPWAIASLVPVGAYVWYQGFSLW